MLLLWAGLPWEFWNREPNRQSSGPIFLGHGQVLEVETPGWSVRALDIDERNGQHDEEPDYR